MVVGYNLGSPGESMQRVRTQQSGCWVHPTGAVRSDHAFAKGRRQRVVAMAAAPGYAGAVIAWQLSSSDALGSVADGGTSAVVACLNA